MTNPTIIRVAHDTTNPFFMMVRSTAQDESLSWEARGVLAYLLSKPDDWKVMIPDLQQQCGRDKVKRILAELEDAKYLTVDRDNHDKDGHFAPNNYKVHETPFTENPLTVNPSTEKPLTENPQVHKKDVQDTDLHKKELQEIKDSAAIATDTAQTFKAEDEKSVFDEFVDSLDIDQGAKEAEVSKTTPPDDVPAPRKRNHTMDAVCIAFKIEPGGYAQLLIKQLTGIKDGLKGKRLEYLIDDPPMTAIEILACRDWYGTDPRYKDKGALPATAETIFERVLEFRAQPDYETWVNRAGAAFMARTDEDIETPAELPPPNKDMKERVDDVIARLLKGEPVS